MKKFIDQLLLFCGVAFLISIVVYVISSRNENEIKAPEIIAEEIKRAQNTTMFIMALQVLVVVALVCVLFVFVLRVVVSARTRIVENRRAVDGLFPYEPVRHKHGVTLINPNTVKGYVTVQRDGTVIGGDTDSEIVMSAHRTQQIAAMGSLKVTAPLAKYLAGNYDRPVVQHVVAAAPAIEVAPVAPQIEKIEGLSDILRTYTPRSLLLGQSSTGEIARWDLDKGIHLGIVGASGCGKTSSVGFCVVVQAIHAGHDVRILDPKGGSDWRVFQRHAQWQETNHELIVDQFGAIVQEHERRQRLAADHEAQDVMSVPNPPRPIILVIEEYGNMYRHMVARDKAAAQEFDLQMSELMSVARSSDIHIVVIDQFLDQWTRLMVLGMKSKVIFKLGENQGQVVGNYHAQNLPDQGVFIYRGQQYNAWHARKPTEKWLRDNAISAPYTVHPKAQPEVAVENEAQQVDAPVTVTVAPSAPTSKAGWYEWTLEKYLPTHPELLTTDANGNGVGIANLARAMAKLAGNAPANMKSNASEVAAKIRESGWSTKQR